MNPEHEDDTAFCIRVKQRRYDYDLQTKKELLIHQRQTKISNRLLARQAGVAESTIRGWKSQIDLDLEYKSGQMTMHAGPKSKVKMKKLIQF
jgi:hypothetical protein